MRGIDHSSTNYKVIQQVYTMSYSDGLHMVTNPSGNGSSMQVLQFNMAEKQTVKLGFSNGAVTNLQEWKTGITQAARALESQFLLEAEGSVRVTDPEEVREIVNGKQKSRMYERVGWRENIDQDEKEFDNVIQPVKMTGGGSLEQTFASIIIDQNEEREDNYRHYKKHDTTIVSDGGSGSQTAETTPKCIPAVGGGAKKSNTADEMHRLIMAETALARVMCFGDKKEEIETGERPAGWYANMGYMVRASTFATSPEAMTASFWDTWKQLPIRVERKEGLFYTVLEGATDKKRRNVLFMLMERPVKGVLNQVQHAHLAEGDCYGLFSLVIDSYGADLAKDYIEKFYQDFEALKKPKSVTNFDVWASVVRQMLDRADKLKILFPRRMFLTNVREGVALGDNVPLKRAWEDTELEMTKAECLGMSQNSDDPRKFLVMLRQIFAARASVRSMDGPTQATPSQVNALKTKTKDTKDGTILDLQAQIAELQGTVNVLATKT